MKNDAPIDRMKKILELARRGVDGEKAPAEAMLARLLAKYDLTIDDLDGKAAARKMRRFEYSGAFERRLLTQIMARILATSEFSAYSPKRSKTVYMVELTDAEFAEADISFDVYRAALVEHFDLAFSAFLHANRILAPASDRDDDDDDTPVDRERMFRLRMMIDGTKRTDVAPRIGGPK